MGTEESRERVRFIAPTGRGGSLTSPFVRHTCGSVDMRCSLTLGKNTLMISNTFMIKIIVVSITLVRGVCGQFIIPSQRSVHT